VTASGDGARAARRRARAGLAFAAVLLAAGCTTKVVRTPVFDQNGVRVFLRQHTRGGDPVARGFSHPVTIASVRLANILARIDVREEGEKAERKPAISTPLLYAMGDGIAQALAQADASQEVVVMATERRRTHGIFTNDFLTSLVVWVQDDRLYVFLGDLDVIQPRDTDTKPKEPSLDRVSGKAKVLPADGLVPQGPRLVAAAWRDELFRETSAIRVRPGGGVVRRTILMESAPPEEGATSPGPAPPPEGLSPEALRALADLEENRRRGELTEAEYQVQRRQILSGQLPAAPKPPAAP
jgi:hypothetical protein